MVLMALFVFSFIVVATLSADETQKTTGTVMSINGETGEMKPLMADPKTGVDLKDAERRESGQRRERCK